MMLHADVGSVDGEGRRNSDDDVVMQQQLLPVKSVVGTASRPLVSIYLFFTMLANLIGED